MEAVAVFAAGLAAGVEPTLLSQRVMLNLDLLESEIEQIRDDAAGLADRQHLEPPRAPLDGDEMTVSWSPSAHGWVASGHNEEAVATTPADAIDLLYESVRHGSR